MARIPPFHGGGRGSIPRKGAFCLFAVSFLFLVAAKTRQRRSLAQDKGVVHNIAVVAVVREREGAGVGIDATCDRNYELAN